MPVTCSLHRRRHRLPLSLNNGYKQQVNFAPGPPQAAQQYRAADLDVPRNPIEQPYLHEPYSNRIRILVKALDMRAIYHCEPRASVPRSPSLCQVTTTFPQKKRQATISSTVVLQRVLGWYKTLKCVECVYHLAHHCMKLISSAPPRLFRVLP